MNRRLFLSSSAAGCLGPLWWFRQVEPTWFELTCTRVPLTGARPKRVLHISDIHMSDGMCAADLESGLVRGLSRHPDVICLTGDFVSNTSGFDRNGLWRLLRRAADTAPTYAVLGNHDGGKWIARNGGAPSSEPLRELITSAGIRVLHNQAVVEGDLCLVGLADYWSGEFEPERAFAQARRSTRTLVLCHNPDAKQAIRHLHWDIMLSGHTHGGQARIPGITPLWTPVRDKRFVAGLYSWDRRYLFITRGLGSPRHVRAFCRPEVSILELA